MLTYKPTLEWPEYARLTVITNDLDPIYVALYKSGWDEAKLLRWCAAMVTYYHAGAACKLADLQGDDFWEALWHTYDTTPRSSERRHFRGEAGLKAMKHWINTYKTPEKFMLACMKPTFMDALRSGVPQIGVYFTWKACDFREAVFGYDVNWDGAERNMLKSATNGLDVLFGQEGVKLDYSKEILKIIDAIKALPAPPRYSRQCGIAEAETIACGVRQYYTHRVPIGQDIADKRNSLTGFGDNSDHLITCFPKEPNDDAYL